MIAKVKDWANIQRVIVYSMFVKKPKTLVYKTVRSNRYRTTPNSCGQDAMPRDSRVVKQ